MRRPLLLVLYVLVFIILVLYYLNPFGLKVLFDRPSDLISKSGQVASISGTVTKVQIKEYYAALTVKTGSENVLVRLKGLDDEPAIYDLCGRSVNVTGEVSTPAKRRNPGCFDYQLYLKGQGVYTLLEASKFRITASSVKRPITHFMCSLKGRFYALAKDYLEPDNFSILAGLIFGDKSYMDDDLYEQFQQNGIAHVLAVSGLHVGLLYAIITRLFNGTRNIYTTAITILVLYAYAAMSGFSISVLRATCMIVLRLIAFHIGRRYDLVCAATFTAILFLVINPYQLFDSGFQLSFVAAYTIGIVLPWANNKLLKIADEKKLDASYDILSAIAPGICIYVGMAPLIAYHFLNYSLISIFINPIAIALAGIILPAGLMMFAVSMLGIPLFLKLFSFPCSILTGALNLLNSLGEKTHLSGSCTAPPLGLVILFYIFFFYFFSETRYELNRRHRQFKLCVYSFVLCILCFVMPYAFGMTATPLPWKYNTSYVTFVDVGQGDCCHINLDGYNILIDGGGNYYKNIGKDTVKPYLLKNGISHIDLAIVTHKDQDHSKGIDELNECYKIDKIIRGGDTNESSLVCKINIEGLDFLFMADADTKVEKKLLEKYPDFSADVIKLGHHGSKTSSSDEFVKTVDPRLAIISCGLNNSYGHPAPRVIELLSNFDIIYGRTDLNGAISYVKSTDDMAIFTNAAKDTYWLIHKEK